MKANVIYLKSYDSKIGEFIEDEFDLVTNNDLDHTLNSLRNFSRGYICDKYLAISYNKKDYHYINSDTFLNDDEVEELIDFLNRD